MNEDFDERTRKSGSLVQGALDQIRAMIAAGKLRPGDRVNEFQISKSLGISRGPIREAVRRLASSGLLIEEPNVGARVVSPDPEAIRELFLVRELLEGQAAFEAAKLMTEDEKRTLHEVLDRHEALLTGDATGSYSGSNDLDFHRLVLRGSRNALIGRICGNDFGDIFLLLRSRYGQRETRGRRALQEHRWIADAITQGNSEVAAILMRQHIRTSRDFFLEMMDATSNSPEDGQRHGPKEKAGENQEVQSAADLPVSHVAK